MKRLVLAAVLAMLVGACGDGLHGLAAGGPDGGSGNAGGSDAGAGSGSGSGSDGGSGSGDGSGSNGGGPTTARITVVTTEPPALIAFRADASTSWQTPASSGVGTFEFDIDGPYRVVVVCDSPTGAAVVEVAQTLEDDHQIVQPCAPPSTPVFQVTGQMLQPGEVELGDAFDGANSAPWSFSLATEAGTFDLLEFFGAFSDDTHQFAIRRDLAITGDLDLGMIDVATEQAQAMIPSQFTATNSTNDELLQTDVLLHSGNTFALLNSISPASPSAWQVELFPSAALRPTDEQDVQLIASANFNDLGQSPSRTFTRVVHDGGPTSVTLMDPLGPTTLEHTADRLVVTWSALPVFDGVAISRFSFSNDASIFVTHDLVLTRRFVAATGATSATLDFTDVPGFKPEWGHDPTFEQQLGIDVFLGTSPNDSSDASVDELLPAPAPSSGAAQRLPARRATSLAMAHRARVLGTPYAGRGLTRIRQTR